MWMFHVWIWRWLLMQFVFEQLCVQYARASWPISNPSSINLLGLFPDAPNATASETTSLSVHSRAMFYAAIVLAQRFNMMVGEQFIEGQAVQTSGNIIDALSGTCRAISTSNIVGVVGPGFSREAGVIAPLSSTIGIPTISYAATDPGLSDKNAYPSFYRTIPSDTTAASAILKLFLRYNWTSCIIIYQNDAFGSGGANSIAAIFNKNNLTVSDTLVFDLATNSFQVDFKMTLTSSSSRIVILWANDLQTTTIIQSALDQDVLGPTFLWILASEVPLTPFNMSTYPQLIGIMTIEPTVGSTVDEIVNTTLLDAAYAIWQQYEPETFPGPAQVNNYALFSFDATWTLIQSLQELCTPGLNSSLSCLSMVTSSFCFDYRFLHGDLFLHIINTIEFLGVSGSIKFNSSTTDRTDGIYYMVQNVQPSSNGVEYASVLKYSGFGDWSTVTGVNVIVWPGNSLLPFTGLPSLSNVTIRIGVIQSPPFTMLTTIIDASGNNTTNLIGYMPDLINLLQSKMGFIPQIMLAPANQTYDGMVSAVANNVYDIVVGDVTVLAERRQIVDFSSSIFDNSLRIIGRQPTSSNVELFAYLRPFSVRLWLILLVALLYSSVLIFLLERRDNHALKEKSAISAAVMSAWFCFGIFTSYGVDFHVHSAGGRLLCAGLYILSIILVATYTANLASDLTLSRTTNIISGIDDIKNGKIPYSRIGILIDSSFEDYYLREISGGSQNFYPLKTQEETYQFLLENIIDVSINDVGVLEYATNTLYCNLSLIGSDFDPSAYGIVMPKQWVYSQALDVIILSLRESGELDDLTRKWFSGSTCADSSATDTSTRISIEEVGGLFLTFAVISVLAVLLFIWLKRSVMKDYLRSLTRRKQSSVQLADANGNHRNSLGYEPPQSLRPDSERPSAMYL